MCDFFFLENNLGTIWADFAQSGHHNSGKINHNIDSGQSIAYQGEGCVLDYAVFQQNLTVVTADLDAPMDPDAVIAQA